MNISFAAAMFGIYSIPLLFAFFFEIKNDITSFRNNKNISTYLNVSTNMITTILFLGLVFFFFKL